MKVASIPAYAEAASAPAFDRKGKASRCFIAVFSCCAFFILRPSCDDDDGENTHNDDTTHTQKETPKKTRIQTRRFYTSAICSFDCNLCHAALRRDACKSRAQMSGPEEYT